MAFSAKQYTSRYSYIAFGLLFIAFCVFLKASYIIVFQKSYWGEVKQNFVRKHIPIPPKRGNILSDKGKFLASTLPTYKLYIDFVIQHSSLKKQYKLQHEKDSLFLNKLDSLSKGLALILPLKKASEFKTTLMAGYKKKSRHLLVYPYRVSHHNFEQIKKLPFFNLRRTISGLHTEKFYQRTHPFGSLAYRTIGDVYASDSRPKSGLELGLDSILKGVPGVMHRKKVLNKYIGIVDTLAQDGYDVQTTLNVEMQDICEKALRDKLKEIDARWGTCILMEVKTGNIKAIVNLGRKAEGEYVEDVNRAVNSMLEPGSVFKPISFLVAFDDKKIDLSSTVETGIGIRQMYGSRMVDHNWAKGGYGLLSVPDILGKSSNIGVSVLIDQAYHHMPENFVKGIHKTGIADNFKLPIPGYTKAHIRMPERNKRGKDWKNWSNTALPWMSIGYETRVPPIATLAFYNGVANNGKMMRPRLVTSYLKDGEVVDSFLPVVQRQTMATASAIEKLQYCLRWVVSKGLGKEGGSAFFPVSGKTGTAQIWEKGGRTGEYLISFVGYFPSNDPQYSMIVCMRKGRPASGGLHCAPVFRAIAENIMQRQNYPNLKQAQDSLHLLLPETMKGNMALTLKVLEELELPYVISDKSSAKNRWGVTLSTKQNLIITPEALSYGNNKMPNVVGCGARDAVYVLQQKGLKVKIHGIGSVLKQSIPVGNTIARGMEVNLTLGIQNQKKYIKEIEDSTIVTTSL